MKLVPDMYDQAILVAADVEDDAVISYERCRSVELSDIARPRPHGLLDFSETRTERLLCVAVNCPESRKSLASNDSHAVAGM
jgi:hypothetical protein